MNTPTNISRYIMLKTDKPVSKEVMHCWFQCAKAFLPNGVLSTIQSTDNSGSLRAVSMVHREVEGHNEYLLPLTRDLGDREVEPMLDSFIEKNPELNFDVEVSSSQTGLLGQNLAVKIEDNRFNDLCTGWAKKQHESWLKDRIDAGWRYGPSMSLRNKTHPLVRPWHELPDQFRQIDMTQPQSLLDLINDQGYAVISRTELEGILRLLKGGL